MLGNVNFFSLSFYSQRPESFQKEVLLIYNTSPLRCLNIVKQTKCLVPFVFTLSDYAPDVTRVNAK